MKQHAVLSGMNRVVATIALVMILSIAGCTSQSESSPPPKEIVFSSSLSGLFADGGLLVATEGHGLVRVRVDGVPETPLPRGPVTTLAMFREYDGHLVMVGRAQVLKRWTAVDSLGQFALPASGFGGSSTAGAITSAVEDSLVAQWIEQAGKAFDDTVKGAQDAAAKAMGDSVKAAKDVWDQAAGVVYTGASDAHALLDDLAKRGQEVIDWATGTVSVTSVALGFVTSQAPLAWTQMGPPGVGAFKAFEDPLGAVKLARDAVKIQTQAIVATLVVKSSKFWELVAYAGANGFANKTWREWAEDATIGKKAMDIAMDVDAGVRALMLPPVPLPASGCVASPEWTYDADEGFAIRVKNYCSNMFAVNVGPLNAKDVRLSQQSFRMIRPVRPSITLWETVGALGDLFRNLVWGTDTPDTNGLKQFVSLIPTILSAGTVRGLYGVSTLVPVTEDAVKEIKALGDNAAFMWDNGFYRNFQGNSFVYVAPWASSVLPLYLVPAGIAGPGAEWIARAGFLLTTSYELSESNKLFTSTDPETELAEWVEILKSTKQARLGMLANSALVTIDALRVLIDVGQLACNVTVKGVAISIVLQVVKDFLLQPGLAEDFAMWLEANPDVIGSLFKETYGTDSIDPISEMARMALFSSAVVAAGGLIGPALARVFPKVELQDPDTVTNVLKSGFSIFLKLVNLWATEVAKTYGSWTFTSYVFDTPTTVTLVIVAPSDLAAFDIAYIGPVPTRIIIVEAWVPAANALGGLADLIKGVLKQVNQVFGIFAVVSDLEAVVSGVATLMMQQSRGGFFLGSSFCQPAQ